MNFIECKKCTFLKICPSGQRCTKLIKNFKRFCSIGMEKPKKHDLNHCTLNYDVRLSTPIDKIKK